jgi:cytoskeletal protein CcmA (bactofilin family)
MREERGQISGDVVVFEPFTIWGSVGGSVKVIQGGKLYLRGSVYGDLLVEFGGRVHIYGNVTGDLIVERGAKVVHSGILGGDAINLGGRLFIDAQSKVAGKIKTKSGETKVDPKFQRLET